MRCDVMCASRSSALSRARPAPTHVCPRVSFTLAVDAARNSPLQVKPFPVSQAASLIPEGSLATLFLLGLPLAAPPCPFARFARSLARSSRVVASSSYDVVIYLARVGGPRGLDS